MTENDLMSQNVNFICKNFHSRPSAIAMYKTNTMYEQNEWLVSQRTATTDGITIKHSKAIDSILIKKKWFFDYINGRWTDYVVCFQYFADWSA